MMSPFYDEQERKFKLWYRASAREQAERRQQEGVESSEQQSGKRRVFLCYAESADGLRWERPSWGSRTGVAAARTTS